jgi:pyruvate kinase
MMESMIDNPIPTRAEVSDVANAVFDNTDAVMLSAESAVGKFPVETIEAMARICVGAEKHPLTTQSHHRILESCETIDETIAMSAMYAANHLIGTTAIICLTESGATPRLMSRIRSPLPIFACSRDTRTQARVSLYRNVHALALDLEEDNFSANAIFQLMDKGMIKKGDKVIVTQGLATHNHEPGSTNSLQIITI